MNIGKWRRWTAVFLVIILITCGFIQTVHVSASGTDQPVETDSLQGSAEETSALQLFGLENPTQYEDEGTGIDVIDPEDRVADQAEETITEEPAESTGEEIEISQDKDQTQEISRDDNSIDETDADIAEEEAAEEPVEETEAPVAEESGNVLPDEWGNMVYDVGDNLFLTAAAVTSTVKLEDENYNLSYIINNGYQMLCFGNASLQQHTMGSVLIGGNLVQTSGCPGIADSEYSKKPSYVAGMVTGTDSSGFNSRNKQKPVQVLYVGSGNVISDDGKKINGVGGGEGYNHNGTIEYNNNYVDFNKMKTAMVSTSTQLAGGSTKTYNDFVNGQEIHIDDIQAGSSVTFENVGTSRPMLNIKNDSTAFTVITITDSGKVHVPKLLSYNGVQLNTLEDNQDMPVIFNFPNATEVFMPTDLTPSFGHILAPNATVTIEGGNYNGTIVCTNITAKGEGHLRQCHGELPNPGNFDVYIYKVDKNIQGISGAKLAVYDSAGNKVAEFTSNGAKHQLSLPAGNYTLRELEAPSNYLIAADIHFTVADNGVVTSGDAFMVCDNNTVKMKDEKEPCEPYVIVRKEDSKGNLVAGATLEIKNTSGTVLHTIQTDGSSLYRVKLDPGTYILSESVVPSGYKKADDITFTVDCDGKVTKNGQQVSKLTLVMVDEIETGTELKAWKTFNNGTLEGGDFQFTLKAVSGEGTKYIPVKENNKWVWKKESINVPMPQGSNNSTYTVTNAQDGNISFGHTTFTQAGVYTYEITEVSGSYKDSSGNIIYDTRVYKAIVTVTGYYNNLTTTVQYTDSNGNVISESAGNAHSGCPLFENTKVKSKLILKKVNAMDGDMTAELYSQVRFALFCKNGEQETKISGKAENGYWMPDEDGTIFFGDSQPGTYIIREVQAPDNYMKLVDDIVIKVSDTGEITLESGENNYVRLLKKGDKDCPDIATLTDEDKVLMVRNYPYIDMPEAGRNSRWMCFLFGPVLVMIGMGMLLAGKNSKRKEQPAGGDFLS